MIRISSVLLLILLQFISLQLMGQDDTYVFSHLTVNNGLSQNQITCIFCDSDGFVWFGTSTGLNRFDGSGFEVFSTENQPNESILNNTVNALAEDKLGNLWIGTSSGISILDKDTYQFRNFDYSLLAPNKCNDIYYILSVASDRDGNIWIGTNNGLIFYNVEKNSAQHIVIEDKTCNSPVNRITSIAPDSNGNVWSSTQNGMIICYNPLLKSKRFFKIPDNSDKIENSATRLFLDKDNDLWVGNLFGLYLFNIGKSEWLNVSKLPVVEKKELNRVGAISQNVDGLIWVASDGAGAFIIDKKNWNIVNVRHEPFDDQKLSSNSLSVVQCGKDGIVWFGAYKKGINYYKKDIRKFHVFKNALTNPNTLSNNDVNAIAEDKKGNLWIGTDGGGLNYLDRKNNKITRYESNNSNNSLSSNIIVSLFLDHREKLWIGTYLGGLDQFDPSTGKFTVYKHKTDDSTTISDDRIYGITEDSQNNIWCGTLGNGLNRLNTKTGKFERFTTHNSSLCFDMVTSIFKDSQQVLWISTEYGLSSYQPLTGQFTTFRFQANDSSSISNDNVYQCFEDSRGFLWICSKNGLNLLDRNKNTFRHFTTSNGLPSDRLNGISEDKQHNLWISSQNGLTKATITHVKDINTFDVVFTNYNITDGLQGIEFNRSSALCATNGELFFGGPEGLNHFFPEEIRNDTTASKMIFRDFRIFNTPIPHGKKYNKRVVLEKPIFNTQKIDLKYEENSFTIGFIALKYFFPENSKYSYKLEGFDKKWVNTDGLNNSATYTNLNNGLYVFRVKEVKENSKGNEISLTIRVLPPFWKSWIAYLIYIVIISLTLVLLRNLIVFRERMKTKIEQEQIEIQHLQEINSLKIKFFTNISHEFRTPLTLIMASAERLAKELKEQAVEKYLKMINQNAGRLLLMVNQLLDFRKMEVQGFNYNPSIGNIVLFIKEAVYSFNNLSEQKHIALIFKCKIKELNTWFDKDKLEKILFNLLSNAFKFTPDLGEVTVTLLLEENDIEKEKQNLLIMVEDTGIGIPEDKIDKIFTNFFTLDGSGSGTGIGLSLVLEFVKLHGGDIQVTSKVGKGSCFTVILPVVPSENAEIQEISEEVIHDRIPRISNSDDENRQKAGKPVILIADDNDDLRFYLKDNLSGQYDIYEASNGLEALHKIQKIYPELIISDVMMPKMDGIELCKRVKTDRSICHIPFIMLTAKSSEDQQLEGIENGADDYITKPFNFQILEAKILNFINQHKAIKQVFRHKLDIEPKDITVTSLDELFMVKVLELTEKNISNPEYSIETMSRDLGMSRTLLYKKILALSGKPPLDFLRSLRLKRAAQLLSKSQMNVSEIAFQVGFNDPKYFSKHFKNEFGVIPSKYTAYHSNL